MNSADRFDYEMDICKRLGWKRASQELRISRSTLQGRIWSVYPDFKVNTKQGQIMYADDIAEMFEHLSMSGSVKATAERFNKSPATIYHHAREARKHGFDAYPKRPVL